MSNYGAMLLSKVVDTNDVMALSRHNVTESHFPSKVDQKAYKFIKEYAKDNRGKAPSYAVLVENVPQFNYIPQVEDEFKYLTRKLFNYAADEEVANFINGEVDAETKRKDPNATLAQMYENYDGDMTQFLDALKDKLQDIKLRTEVRDKIGLDVKTDTPVFKEEYRRRKNGESHKIWKSRFAAIGKYTSGNMYVVYGKSGRGKSVVTISDMINLAQQGAKCLMWAMEMPFFEIFVRIYSILSADAGVRELNVNGIDMSAGFDTADMRDGTMADDFEEQLFEFIDKLNETLPGSIIIRCVDDDDFNDRSLNALEADIIETSADVVVIDPFYYLDYERNNDKTTGGAAAATSQRLRKMAGRMKVVMIAITQAGEGDESVDDDGKRDLDLPKRKEVTKTASLMQDAYQLIAIDTDYKQGRGLVGNNKGRDGGEGDFTEIMYLPQYGICRQLYSTEPSLADFAEF